LGLQDYLNGDEPVTSVHHSAKRGLFAPVTWSGSLFVSGVCTSVHVAVVPQMLMNFVGIPAMWLSYKLGESPPLSQVVRNAN
jgi:hypothetical protein